MQCVPLSKEPLLQRDPGDGIERRERLVQEQKIRSRTEGAREGGALAHAARQFPGVPCAPLREPDAREHFPGGPQALRFRPFLHCHRQHHIFFHREPGKKQILLRHIGGIVPAPGPFFRRRYAKPRAGRSFWQSGPFRMASARGQRRAVQPYASCRRRLQPVQQTEQRCLAASARPDDTDETSVLDPHGKTPEDFPRGIRVCKMDVFEFQHENRSPVPL